MPKRGRCSEDPTFPCTCAFPWEELHLKIAGLVLPDMSYATSFLVRGQLKWLQPRTIAAHTFPPFSYQKTVSRFQISRFTDRTSLPQPLVQRQWRKSLWWSCPIILLSGAGVLYSHLTSAPLRLDKITDRRYGNEEDVYQTYMPLVPPRSIGQANETLRWEESVTMGKL